MEKLRAERRHDWEKLLTEQDEELLLKGVEKYRAQFHDLILYHEGAKIDVFEPPMVISLYALAEAFHKKPDAAQILEDWTDNEVAGAALHLAGRYMDTNNLAQIAHDIIADAQSQVTGIEHVGRDDIRGVVDFGVTTGGPMNVVAIDLARIGAEVKKKLEQDERAPLLRVVREQLRAAVDRNDNGSLWMRPPTDEERSLLRRAIGS